VSSLSYGVIKEEESWSSVAINFKAIKRGWRIQSSKLSVFVQEDGSLSFESPLGIKIHEQLPPMRKGNAICAYAKLKKGERVFGLGERAFPLDLRGRVLRLWNRDPGGSYGFGEDPIYLCIPVLIGAHHDGNYLLFFDNPWQGKVDLGAEDSSLAKIFFEGGALRFYFTTGDLSSLLSQYTELTGRPPMPPRWALGYHQSRWGYKTEAKVREIVNQFKHHQISLSTVHLDTDYMPKYSDFAVDRKRFPSLLRLASNLRKKGIHLVAILDPGVRTDPRSTLYQSGSIKKMFVKLKTGKFCRAPAWPGWCLFPDFTDPKVRKWWATQYSKLLDEGIDGVWHDMNEPEAFVVWGDPTLPLSAWHNLEGKGGSHLEAHNVYALLMAQAGFQGLLSARPEKRPFILSRSGWAGIQRYAWTWTGDTESSWSALALTIPTILNLGLSGIPFCGPDIGGFSGAPSAELYLRWLQLAAFLPFFRTHSAMDTPDREPWSFGEPYTTYVRKAIELRYSLFPYLYTLAWEAHAYGWPLVRPLFWLGSANEELLEVDDAFLLGDAILVAPVLEEGARSREVRLPPGTWYDFWSDTTLKGPGQVRLEAPLERILLLISPGKVLPIEDSEQHKLKRIFLHAYVPSTSRETESFLYIDKGDGYGPFRLDRFRISRNSDYLEFTWNSEGAYHWPYQETVVVLHGADLKGVKVDGSTIRVNENQFRVDRPFSRAVLEISLSSDDGNANSAG
jgi:alpha-glucosidase